MRLGHVVSVALDAAATNSAGREHRRAAISALRAVWNGVADASILSCFFPGVVSALGRLVAGCDVRLTTANATNDCKQVALTSTDAQLCTLLGASSGPSSHRRRHLHAS
jgi:hypothetical protein